MRQGVRSGRGPARQPSAPEPCKRSYRLSGRANERRGSALRAALPFNGPALSRAGAAGRGFLVSCGVVSHGAEAAFPAPVESNSRCLSSAFRHKAGSFSLGSGLIISIRFKKE